MKTCGRTSTAPWNLSRRPSCRCAEDAADAVLKLLDSDFIGKVNLGTGKSHSIKEITDIIERLSNKKIISENKLVTGPMKFLTDIILNKTMIKKGLTYPLTTFEEYITNFSINCGTLNLNMENFIIRRSQ